MDYKFVQENEFSDHYYEVGEDDKKAGLIIFMNNIWVYGMGDGVAVTENGLLDICRKLNELNREYQETRLLDFTFFGH